MKKLLLVLAVFCLFSCAPEDEDTYCWEIIETYYTSGVAVESEVIDTMCDVTASEIKGIVDERNALAEENQTGEVYYRYSYKRLNS